VVTARGHLANVAWGGAAAVTYGGYIYVIGAMTVVAITTQLLHAAKCHTGANRCMGKNYRYGSYSPRCDWSECFCAQRVFVYYRRLSRSTGVGCAADAGRFLNTSSAFSHRCLLERLSLDLYHDYSSERAINYWYWSDCYAFYGIIFILQEELPCHCRTTAVLRCQN